MGSAIKTPGLRGVSGMGKLRAALTRTLTVDGIFSGSIDRSIGQSVEVVGRTIDTTKFPFLPGAEWLQTKNDTSHSFLEANKWTPLLEEVLLINFKKIGLRIS
jgi:hypothetical protein